MVLHRPRPGLLLLALLALIAIEQPRSARAGTAPDWTGDFADFNTPAWRQHWGVISDTLMCGGAVGSAGCNWGYANLKGIAGAELPNGGRGALEVTYPAPSGPPSCMCGLGGGQFYQDLKAAGQTALVASPTIDLKYWYRFPVGFDFGKMTAGKMPGLYGGPPGCGSGGQRCGNAWSTRYMWRGGSQASPNGQVYWYSENGTSGFGEDLGTGSWRWLADGKWHSIEQLLNFQTGRMTVWHDGQQVFAVTRDFAGTPVLGVFFSTFHGGHETTWSPSKLTRAEFSSFTLSTDGPQTAAGERPANPDAGASTSDGGNGNGNGTDTGVDRTGEATGGTSGGSGGAPGSSGSGGNETGGTTGATGVGGSNGTGGAPGGSNGSGSGGFAGAPGGTTPETGNGGSAGSSVAGGIASGCRLGGDQTTGILELTLAFLALLLSRVPRRWSR